MVWRWRAVHRRWRARHCCIHSFNSNDIIKIKNISNYFIH
jgi:hypothetical protein